MKLKNVGIAIAICVSYVAGLISTDVKSYLIKFYYSDKYSTLSFKCDTVMREQFIAKQLVVDNPNSDTASLLTQAEIGLIDCQDYDILRKKLLGYGLSEADLAELSLISIEEKSDDIRKVVEIHEIKYN